jgi:hypothetical protein
MTGKLAKRVLCVAATLLALGLAACGGADDGAPTAKAPDYDAALAGAPKPLARL